MKKLSEKKRALNIFDSLLTYELVNSDTMRTQIKDFCLTNIQITKNFGFQCEVFRFLQREEMRDILAQVTQLLDQKKIKALYEVVQNE